MRTLRTATKIDTKFPPLKSKRGCPKGGGDMRAGFTLVEMIVAIGLFTVSVMISIGSLISLFDANRKSQTLFSATTNLNYVLESVTRTIRFGERYHCINSGSISAPQDCPSGDSFLAVTTDSGTVIYRHNGTSIERSDNGGVTYKKITGSDVSINYVRFYALSTTAGDNNQPRVIIVVRGYSGSKPSSMTYFDIETQVSQRDLDL